MRTVFKLAATIAILAAHPARAQDAGPAVSLKSPAAFGQTLKEMGFSPTAVTVKDSTPEFDVDIDSMPTTIKFIGCTGGKDCKYIALVSGYTDVVNPPVSWMQKMNDEFDMLKVGLKSDKSIYLFAAHVVNGMPRAELRRILDYWAADTAAISDEARKAGLVSKN